MQTPATRLSFRKQDQDAWIRISGTATLHVSGSFKQLVHELIGQGIRHLHIDLSQCPNMDSTFVGILTRMALDSRRMPHDTDRPHPESIELVQPNQSIRHLLDTLDLTQFFPPPPDLQPPAEADYTPFTSEDAPPNSNGMARTLYEAHKTLSDISPENKQKFEGVIQCAEEELARQEDAPDKEKPRDDTGDIPSNG